MCSQAFGYDARDVPPHLKKFFYKIVRKPKQLIIGHKIYHKPRSLRYMSVAQAT